MRITIVFIFSLLFSTSLTAQFGQGNFEDLAKLRDGKLYVVTNFTVPSNLRLWGKGVKEREEAVQSAFQQNWDFCKFECITFKDYLKMKKADKTGNFFLGMTYGTNRTTMGYEPGAVIINISKDNGEGYNSSKNMISFLFQTNRLNYKSNEVFIPWLNQEIRVLNNYLKDAMAENTFDLTSKINNRSIRLKKTPLLILKNSFCFKGESDLKAYYKNKIEITNNSSGQEIVDAITNKTNKKIFMLGYGINKDYILVIDPKKGELIYVGEYVNKGFVKCEFSTNSLEDIDKAVKEAKGE